MTEQNINSKILEESINEIKDENFKKQLREWLVYSAPKEVIDIWSRYCEKMEALEEHKQNQRQKFIEDQAEAHKWLGIAAMIVAIGVFIYYLVQTYELIFNGCVR